MMMTMRRKMTRVARQPTAAQPQEHPDCSFDSMESVFFEDTVFSLRASSRESSVVSLGDFLDLPLVAAAAPRPSQPRMLNFFQVMRRLE